MHALAAPMLVLAAAQAIWVALVGAWHRRGKLRSLLLPWKAIGSPAEHPGGHTVPLGIAVMAGALQAHAGTGGALAAVAWLPLAVLVLAWVATLVCVGRFTLSLILRDWSLQDFDGTWFLVPAALLGTVLATTELIPRAAPVWPTGLAVLLLVVGSIGWCGYWVAAFVAARRVKRHRFRGRPLVSWWIAMGCAGLAAAMLGGLLDPRAPWSAPVRGVLGAAMLVTIVAALVLLLPVIARSVHFLACRCRFRDAAGWPPTFSTAVLALGCLATGERLHAPAFHLLGWWAGVATVALWAATMAWNVVSIIRRRL